MKKFFILFTVLLLNQSVHAQQTETQSQTPILKCPTWILAINSNDESSKEDLMKVIYNLQGLDITNRNWTAEDAKAIYFTVDFARTDKAFEYFKSPQGLGYRQNLATTLSALSGVKIVCGRGPQTNPRGSVSN